MKLRTLAASIILGSLLLCTRQFASTGTGSGWEAKTARGTIVLEDGSAAQRTVVRILPADFDPSGRDTLPDSLGASDTTDETGSYEVHTASYGAYTIQAVQISERTRLFIRNVIVDRDTVVVPADTLHKTGTIKVSLPGGLDAATGYIYIPGSMIFAPLTVADGFAVLDSVPCGIMPAVCYNVKNGAAQQTIRFDVPVFSAETTLVARPGWLYAKRLYLNTTANGASVSGNVMNFPVLVRLAAGNFPFNQAQPDGRDVRFTNKSDSLLPYEIEQWDSAGGKAAVWVKVDTVYGNSNTRYILMYWGASAGSATASLSNSTAVFDTMQGFQGVWHLNESSDPLAHDATQNLYHGAMTATAAVKGIIGNAQQFDGASSFIQMTGTANSKLNFPENGAYTLSAWVYADTLDGGWHMIAGKGHQQYYLKISNVAEFEFVEYHGNVGWQGSVAPAAQKSWKYLVGIRSGTRQFLYLDGELIDSSYRTNPDTLPRNTSDDFSIGKYLEFVTSDQQGFDYFNGIIDEVCAAGVPRSPDWIRLCYMRADDKLVVFNK
jgi:hypothetical protein